MKFPIQGALLRAVPPTKIVWRSAMGTPRVSTKKAMPRLKLAPAMNTVVVVPVAIPLMEGGTEFITDALLGDWKSPIPAPTSASGRASCQKVIVLPMVESRRKPVLDTMSPDVAKNLGP